MGSRAVVVVCRDPSVAATRFGIESKAGGSIFTRTGRPFFADGETEAALPRQGPGGSSNGRALGRAWRPTGSSSTASFCPGRPRPRSCCDDSTHRSGRPRPAPSARSEPPSRPHAARGVDVEGSGRRSPANGRPWSPASSPPTAGTAGPVNGIDDLKLAPFQILAGEGARPCPERPPLAPRGTRTTLLTPTRPPSGATQIADGRRQRSGIGRERHAPGGRTLTAAGARAWWSNRSRSSTGDQGIGPARDQVPRAASTSGSSTGPSTPPSATFLDFVLVGSGSSAHWLSENFALGIEALERFVAGEPLYRVHECVFGVLALESEPVDPRL